MLNLGFYRNAVEPTFGQLTAAIKDNPGQFLRKTNDPNKSSLQPLANYALRRLIVEHPDSLHKEKRFNYLHASCQGTFEKLISSHDGQAATPIKDLQFSGVDAKIMNSLKLFLVDYQGADTLNLNEVKSLIDSLDFSSAHKENKFDLIENFYLKLHQEWILNDGWAHQNDIKILHNVLGLPEYNQKFYDFQTAHANPASALKLGKAADDGNCYLTSTLLVAQCAKEHPEHLVSLSSNPDK